VKGEVGDAAWAPSFLAGEGCGLGIIGAYVLARELARSAGDPSAFAAYESRLRGFIQSKQKMATRFGGAFCPKTRFGVIFRNWAASLLNLRLLANFALSRELKDDIDLPDYAVSAT
jgi:2-polyprenyl-6-methoxyphenol hydroxylase-like FAD-dependent oxidoreductase